MCCMLHSSKYSVTFVIDPSILDTDTGIEIIGNFFETTILGIETRYRYFVSILLKGIEKWFRRAFRTGFF
jgi:hypothetical protein